MPITLKCYHCGRAFSAPSKYRALQALRSHLQHCPKRKIGIALTFGEKDALRIVTPSAKLKEEIVQFYKSLEGIGDNERYCLVVGFISRIVHEQRKRPELYEVTMKKEKIIPEEEPAETPAEAQ